jgi:hypothetical protein
LRAHGSLIPDPFRRHGQSIEEGLLMDNLELLQTLEHIRSEVAAMRADVGTLRAEAAAQHVRINRQLDGISEVLTSLNERLRKLENQEPPATSVSTTGVCEIARTAILGLG